MSRGGALGAGAPRTRGPEKKKEKEKKEREGKKRRKRRKERKKANDNEKYLSPPTPAKWISNIPPWAHTSDAPTILGVCVCVGGVGVSFPPQKYRDYPFFLGIFQVNFKDILTKKGLKLLVFSSSNTTISTQGALPPCNPRQGCWSNLLPI